MKSLDRFREHSVAVIAVGLLAVLNTFWAPETRPYQAQTAWQASAEHSHGLGGASQGESWKQDQVIAPEDLVKWRPAGQKPVVLQVGIAALYENSHIPGSIFAGPASEPEGIDMLKKEVKPLPRTADIVLYCGCCPFKDCPNVRPAFTLLQQMGFKKVKVLGIPNDFLSDWVNKGFPVEK